MSTRLHGVRFQKMYSLFFHNLWGGVRLSLLGMLAYCTSPGLQVSEAVGGKRTSRGNRSTRRKLAPVLLFPPQILHDLISDRTRAATVGDQPLTARAMVGPCTGMIKSCNTRGRDEKCIQYVSRNTWKRPHVKKRSLKNRV
jgi:hypothetical protein